MDRKLHVKEKEGVGVTSIFVYYPMGWVRWESVEKNSI